MAGTIRGLGPARFCPLTQVLKPLWLQAHEQEPVWVLGSSASRGVHHPAPRSPAPGREILSRRRVWQCRAGVAQALAPRSSTRSSDVLLRSWLLFFYEPVV